VGAVSFLASVKVLVVLLSLYWAVRRNRITTTAAVPFSKGGQCTVYRKLVTDLLIEEDVAAPSV
jgi:hypothetical protein